MLVEVITDGQQVLEHAYDRIAAPKLLAHDDLLVNQLQDKQTEAGECHLP